MNVDWYEHVLRAMDPKVYEWAKAELIEGLALLEAQQKAEHLKALGPFRPELSLTKADNTPPVTLRPRNRMRYS